uniref:Uncharacterized protein n=1 Tax=Rhizophora mucronata TaxID=61149 RepID=A0A2P2J541_RHIMU
MYFFFAQAILLSMSMVSDTVFFFQQIIICLLSCYML